MTTFDSRRTLLPVFIVAAVGLCAVLLIGHFVVHDLWLFGVAAATMAALWLFGWRRGWAMPIDLGFVGMVGLATYGAIVSTGRPTVTLTVLLMLAATVSALAAWDLMRFDLRQRTFAPRTPATHGLHQDARLQHRHLRRIVVVTGVGLATGALAILLRTQLTFASIALVLLLALLLFGLSLRELRADA